MKRLTMCIVLIICSLVVVNNASSLTIAAGNIDVGNQDFIVAEGSTKLINSSLITETTWVNEVLNGNYTLNYKFEEFTTNIFEKWYGVSNSNGLNGLAAYELHTAPEYFILKIGNGVGYEGDTHFLFDNTTSMNWAVVDPNTFTNVTLCSVSHVSEFTTVAPVPEPSTLLLLGSGLAMSAFIGRRKIKKNERN